ncbi:hypothetical protein CI610_00121 [invertebrate metagenome]|uniref:Uncharacterized protein n=1 Tax=invertebrate metagenome TaxID=1711999 RepID=A0A2H9TCF7_9ZZZZ
MQFDELTILFEYDEEDSEDVTDYEDRLFPYPDRFLSHNDATHNQHHRTVLSISKNNKSCNKFNGQRHKLIPLLPQARYSDTFL